MPSSAPPCKPPTLPTCPHLAEDHLEPIRAFVHAGHGRMARLTEEMRKRTSTPITRQAVSRWLHKDADKRQEPKLGAFLVMEAALRAVQAEASGQSAASADA